MNLSQISSRQFAALAVVFVFSIGSEAMATVGNQLSFTCPQTLSANVQASPSSPWSFLNVSVQANFTAAVVMSSTLCCNYTIANTNLGSLIYTPSSNVKTWATNGATFSGTLTCPQTVQTTIKATGGVPASFYVTGQSISAATPWAVYVGGPNLYCGYNYGNAYLGSLACVASPPGTTCTANGASFNCK